MKKIKQIDCLISIALIIVFLILSLINHDLTLMVGYFVVGGWQVISMIVHAINKWFTEKDSRRYVYHWVVFWLILVALAGLAANTILAILAFPMLLAAPLMAIYYTWICYDEVYVKMKRPLSLIK